MREAPRQPRGLDSRSESELAFIGHRIEIWQEMLHGSEPFEKRQNKLVASIDKELASLRGDGGSSEANLLEQDLDIAWGLVEHNEDVLRAECEERIDHYATMRQDWIAQKGRPKLH